MQMRRARERCENLATVDDKAPVDGRSRGGDAGGGTSGNPLGKGLSVNMALVDHTGEHGLAAFVVGCAIAGSEVQGVGNGTSQQHGGRVHVERERRGTAVAADLLGHQRIGGEVCAESAVLGWHAQAQETDVAQVGEVLVGKRRLTIVCHRALGEHRSQLGDLGNQLALTVSGPSRVRTCHGAACICIVASCSRRRAVWPVRYCLGQG